MPKPEGKNMITQNLEVGRSTRQAGKVLSSMPSTQALAKWETLTLFIESTASISRSLRKCICLQKRQKNTNHTSAHVDVRQFLPSINCRGYICLF